MTLASNSSFGPYTILAPLGAGGMGAVYRARDTKLGRDIAVKVLPPEFAADRERLARFEQEARAASALNHPNIITIFEVGQADGTPYMAMEVVDGRSLRDLLDDGKLPLRKALAVAAQIADGLAAAHERGVVHRDLKPENVMVTKSGHVKLLDFGLAKLAAPPEQDEATVQMAGQTRPGTVMGTVGYMSPEQAAGAPADHRSDQFSLGAILYEMLAGRRAFQKATSVETLTAILREEPPPLAPSDLPPVLRWIVERLLAKTADERYDSTRDLARDLQRVRDSLSDPTLVSGAAPAVAPPSRRRRWLAPVAAVIAVALLGGAAWMGAKRFAQPQVPQFHRVAFRRGYVSSARFTSDGQTIVYGAAWEGQPIRVFSTREDNPTAAAFPLPPADVLSVSKGGAVLLNLGRRFTEWFVTNGTLAEVPLAGGSAPREMQNDVQEADWLPDGKGMVVVRNVERQTILEFPAGKARYTTSGWVSHARVSPDGNLVAFFDHPLRGADNGFLAVIGREGEPRHLGQMYSSAQGIAWRPDGKEIWYTAADIGFFSQLHASTLDGKSRVVYRGPARLVLHDVAADGRILLDSQTPQIGVAVMVPGETTERDLSWLDCSFAPDLTPDGKTLLISEQGEGGGPQYSVYVRPTDGSPATRIADGFGWGLSPDGKWAITQAATDGQQLSLVPTGAGTPRQFSTGVGDSLWPQFFPDGKRILYAASTGSRPARLYAQPVDGGKAVPVSPEGYGGTMLPRAVSPDGKRLAVTGPQGKLMMVNVDGGTPQPVPGAMTDEIALRWSADGGALFTFVLGDSPARIYRLDLQNGQRRVWREFRPADSTGLLFMAPTAITPDGSGYAYTFGRMQSQLFVVTGLK